MRLLRALVRLFFRYFYTSLAWSYDLVAWLVSVGKWNDWVRSAVPPAEQDPVLELGHGPGHLLAALSGRRRRAFGVDASPQMGRIARQRLLRGGHPLRIVRARAQALPFPAGAFGSLISTFPTEFILQPATLDECWRALRPGGRFVILPMAEIRGKSILERLAAWLFRVTGQSGELPGTWEDPIRSAGFETRRDELELRNSTVIRVVAQR